MAPRRRRVSVRVLITSLVLALLVPSVMVLGYVLADFADKRREEIVSDGDRTAVRIADTVGRRFESMSVVLAVLGGSGWIEDEQYELLHFRASTALTGTGQFLLVLDENFNQILNTRVPYGTALRKTSNIEVAQHVLETGLSAVSDIFEGGVAGVPVFNLLRRYRPETGPDRVLILTSNAAELGTVIDAETLPQGWHYALLDGSGALVTTYGAADEHSADLPGECTAATVETSVDYFVSYHVPGSPWRVCGWAMAADIGDPVRGGISLFLLVSGGLLLLGIAGAVLLGNIIRREIAAAARAGRAADGAAGAESGRRHSVVAEVDEVLEALDREARARQSHLDEKDLLLKEATHRAKNQIAIATALVRLSARKASSVENLRDDLGERFGALGRSADLIASNNWHSASFRRLVRSQLSAFVDPDSGALSVSGDDVMMAPTAAQSFGLVMHELGTNASKYGAWSVPGGRVSVDWKAQEDGITIRWRETGGPPAVADQAPRGTGFGSTLIDTLVKRSFAGTIERGFGPDGFVCTLTLPWRTVREAPPEAPSEAVE